MHGAATVTIVTTATNALPTTAAISATATSTTARHDDRHDGYRDNRYDNRYDNRHYGYNNGYNNGYHNGYRMQMRRGERLSRDYGSYYVVNDWNRHNRLYAPQRGYQWVQVGGDYALVAIATGIIAHVLLNN
ncbi:RcnB family protein [Massilia sp. H-1]|nr:RcnB family protein [Massilia sp. H-1]